MHERIAKIIDTTGLKKIEFAKRLGISAPFVSELCTGVKKTSDRTITDICREFNISEVWLRTGEGKMFMPKSRTDEISAFVGDVLKGEPDFRQKFISVLARMTSDEWKILENKVLELAEEIKKADP